MSARANTEEVGDGDSSTEDVSFSPSDEKVVRAALHSRNFRLQENEDDLTPGSTAVLRALSADGDLRWLSNVGNVNEMFRRLSNCLSEMQIEVRDQVRREMDANLAEVKVALNETVEMSSQRNKQLEVAVAAAEQAFRERDEARGLLAEANRRLAEYTAKVEDLETSVGEAIDSASGFAVLSDQLTEQRTLTERYRKALKEAEDRLRAMEKLDKSNKAKLQEAEASASSKAEYLRQQLRIQQAEASEARQRHETEASGLRTKLRASRERERAALALADGSGTAKDRLARDKAAFQDTVALQEQALNRMRNELLERHHTELLSGSSSWQDSKPTAEALEEAERASLVMFHVDQLMGLADGLLSAGRSQDTLAALQEDLRSAVEQMRASVVSDTRRMAHYESHIGRLSQGVIDARNQAMELQKVLKDVGDQEEMEELRRQIALYKGKEERLENRVADLEVQVDRRTLQCQSAERRMAEAQEQAGALETQLEELRGSAKESAQPSDATRLRSQLNESLEALEMLRATSQREVEMLRKQLKEENARRERVESYYTAQVADLEKELRMTRQQEGARGSSSSGAGGRPMSPESSIARLADEVADMKSFCTSAEEQMQIMRVQLERASDLNQELEEKTRQLTHDRDDLQDEVRKMRSSLREATAGRPDLDSAHLGSSTLRAWRNMLPSGEVVEDEEQEGEDGEGGQGRVAVPPAVIRRAAEFAGDEGLARPRTASPSSVLRSVSRDGRHPVEPPAPPEVIQLAALYSGEEGDSRPLTAAPSRRPDAAVGALNLRAIPVNVMTEGRRASDQGYGDEDGSMDDVSFGNLIPSADVSDGIGANPTGVGPVRTRRFRSGTGDEALADEEDDRVGGGTQRRTRGRHLKNPVGRHNEGSHQAILDKLREERGRIAAACSAAAAAGFQPLQRPTSAAGVSSATNRSTVQGGLVADRSANAGLDEEVVMRALRRAGLVQEELRRQWTEERPQALAEPSQKTRKKRFAGRVNRFPQATEEAPFVVQFPPQRTRPSGGRILSVSSRSYRFSSPNIPRPSIASQGRSKSAGRTRSSSAGRSKSAGKQRTVSLGELYNPAGVLTAGTNAQMEQRWVWNRFNPSKPFQPHTFSSVMRSQVFDEAQRQSMIAGKAIRRSR